ncbi:MAG: head GIN domain-containing protein [Panacibacter sp.]
MKKIFTPFIALAIFATATAQEKTRIEPSGKIITKEVSVQPFDGIDAKGLYELVLSQGDRESVKIEADDNLMDLFSVKNNGSRLIIDMPDLKDKNIDFKDNDGKKSLKLKVYVTFKNIKHLEVAVIGNVHSATALKSSDFTLESKNVGNINLELTADKLTVENKGVGNITLRGNVKNADVINRGVGQFEGEDLLVQTMNIDNKGVGRANVNVEKDLTIKQTFLGKVNNKGAAKTHAMEGVEM